MEKDNLILRSICLQWLLAQALPQLRKWPVSEWSAVLDRSLVQEFDRYELIGIGAGVALVTWFLEPVADPDASFAATYLTQLLLAIPCLAVVAGPFYLRRFRRGLDTVAGESRADEGFPPS